MERPVLLPRQQMEAAPLQVGAPLHAGQSEAGRFHAVEKFRISGKLLKNAGTEFRRDDTMTVRVLPAVLAAQSSSLYVGTTLFGLVPSCAHLSFLTAMLRTRSSYIHQDWLDGYKVNYLVHFHSGGYC